MGLFNRNNLTPTKTEEELIATTLLLKSVFERGGTQLAEGYSSSIASYSKNIAIVCETQVADLLINAYQREGNLIKNETVLNNYVCSHDEELTLEYVTEIVDTIQNYVEETEEVFKANKNATEEVIEEIVSRAQMIKAYTTLIQSGIVINNSGFEIKNDKSAKEADSQAYGRYV